ncbi:MAG: DNA-directed RNA polymerase subunit alpha [Patescibacteria group bacterium]
MIGDINLPTVKIEERADNRTVFVVEPCYPGYGTTVGNALRRVLLGSLPGAAVIGVKIAGVDHEFSPINGLKEDAVQVILQAKKLRFRLTGEQTVTLKLKATKAGEVTGKDIELPAGVELINEDLVLGTLSGKDGFEMDIIVAPGRGYKTTEEIDEENFSIGTIAVDASFSPVQRVAYTVEPTRVGEMINYDKLTIDVLTDGTIDPETALRESAQILANQLSVFGAEIKDMTQIVAESKTEEDTQRDYTVDEINLSIRTTNALHNNGLETVSDILAVGPDKLSEMKGLGAKALDELTEKLEELGLKFEENN